MKNGILSNVTRVSILGAVAAGSLLAAPPAIAPCNCGAQLESWSFPAEASQLLQEIRSSAAKLTRHTSNLESYTFSNVSWQRHAEELNAARRYVNEMGEQLHRLQTIRHVAEPWQQQALDSIHPIAADLAARTEAAILHLNDNRMALWKPSYTGHLKSLADRAGRMKEAADLHLDLAQTQDKLEALRDKAVTLGS